MIRLDLDTRTSVAFLGSIVGLAWQGVVFALGGTPSAALVSAFTTVLLATIGIGFGKNGKNGKKGRGDAGE